MKPLVVALLVAIGILAGFWSGDRVGSMRSAKSVSAASQGGGAGARAGAGGAGGPGGGGGFGGGRGGGFGGAGSSQGGAPLYGQVVSSGPGMIVIHDGTSDKDVRVELGKAAISRVTDASASDLTTNTQVTVLGQRGPDGTVNARLVTIGTLTVRGGANPNPGS